MKPVFENGMVNKKSCPKIAAPAPTKQTIIWQDNVMGHPSLLSIFENCSQVGETIGEEGGGGGRHGSQGQPGRQGGRPFFLGIVNILFFLLPGGGQLFHFQNFTPFFVTQGGQVGNHCFV